MSLSRRYNVHKITGAIIDYVSVYVILFLVANIQNNDAVDVLIDVFDVTPERMFSLPVNLGPISSKIR